MTPEGEVKRDIKALLKSLGYQAAGAKTLDAPPAGWYYMPVNNGMGAAGIPDFVLCRRFVVQQRHVGGVIGMFGAIEAKAPGGKVSGPQEDRHTEIAHAGGDVIVCDDVNQLAAWRFLNGR